MQNSHFLPHHLPAVFSLITGNLCRCKATIHFGLLLCFLSFPFSPTCFPILLQPLKYPSCCPTQFFDFLRRLPISCQRQLWWLSPGTAQLAWQHVHEVLMHNSHVCFTHFHQHSSRMGVFPAARQEMASAVSPQSAAHLKVLHSSTSRFFHWGKHVYC